MAILVVLSKILDVCARNEIGCSRRLSI